MHTMRAVPALAAVQQAVHAGAIGDPLMSFSQKTYRWGKTRPDFYRDRKTFPVWPLGSAFTPSTGCTGSSAMSSPKYMDARGRRPTPTTRPAPARRPLY